MVVREKFIVFVLALPDDSEGSRVLVARCLAQVPSLGESENWKRQLEGFLTARNPQK